jgi:hypothetical protein
MHDNRDHHQPPLNKPTTLTKLQYSPVCWSWSRMASREGVPETCVVGMDALVICASEETTVPI